jgi:hypothetical protein
MDAISFPESGRPDAGDKPIPVTKLRMNAATFIESAISFFFGFII